METSIQVSNIYNVAFWIIIEYNLVAHLKVRRNVIPTISGINCMKNISVKPSAAYNSA
jgi:hypothetical protein